MAKILFVISFLLCFYLNSIAQELDDIIKLHRSNLEHLYESRGVIWDPQRNPGERDLTEFLDLYSQNICILIYTHNNDSLNIVLLTKKGQVWNSSYPITKDSLINEIWMANYLFSERSLSRAPKLRGSDTDPKFSFETEKRNSFARINKILLPDSRFLKDCDHLIIVPVLNIAAIPFAALKISGDTLLIEKMSYSIAPSLFELMVSGELNKIKTGSEKRGLELSYSFSNAALIADPEFADTGKWIFPKLPGTLKEINNIKQYLNDSSYRVFQGANATQTNILENICNYDLLYFATHGVSNSRNPLDNSYLVLAKDEIKGSFLTARIIQNFREKCKLNADLIVLSACQTGLGKEHDGGFIGLARAFNIAGANHILTSLWSIDDEETAKIMGFFFGNLKSGGSLMPHEALRQAMLKYKNQVNPDPYFWSAFCIFGIPF